MSAWIEMAVDECVSGEKVLRLLGRFEPLQLPFSASCRSMRVLGPVVEISALLVLDVGKHLTLRHTVASQLVGDDHPGSYCSPLSNFLKKRLAAFASRRC